MLIQEDEHFYKVSARFWQNGNTAISIVASVSKGIDWAAYIGCSSAFTQRECCENALKYGEKLSEADAKYFFPSLAELLIPYRY